MEIKEEHNQQQQQLENYFIGTKRKTPPPPLPATLLKKVKEESIPQNEAEEMEMKTDDEIKQAISRIKISLKSFGIKLRDGGEKLKVSLRKYEDELERRNKIKPAVLPVNIPVSAPAVLPVNVPVSEPAELPVNIPVSASAELPVNVPVSAPAEPKSLLLSSPAPASPPEPQQSPNTHSVSAPPPLSAPAEPKSLLLSSPAPPPEPQQSPNTHSVDSVQQMISNGDKKDGASNISSPSHGLEGKKPLSLSESQHGVATKVPTADAHKHDSWTDEMIQNIHDEVVTVATESRGRNPSASGNDDRPPVTFLKGGGRVFVQQNQEQDIELKTDSEIKETIARLKRNMGAFGHKLHDKGEKIKESIRRYEHELQRRNKIRPGVLPVNIPVLEQVNLTSQLLLRPVSPQECPRSPVTDGCPLENSYQTEDSELVMKSDRELNETIARIKNNLKSCGKLRDGGKKIRENLKRHEDELKRRLKRPLMQKIRPGVLPVNIPVSAQVNPKAQLLSKPASPLERPQSPKTRLLDSVKQMIPNDGKKDGDSNIPSRDHVAGNKPSSFSQSQYGVAANGSTANADKHDSLTDEKMLKIVRELVTVGIAQTEIGKAAEVCYKDPVKAKVLFALPGHLRKSYVCGFLYPRK